MLLSHFIDEETEAETVSYLTKATQFVKGRAGT